MKIETTDDVGKYLVGAKIIRMYTPRGIEEGGLTIIFDKGGNVGIYIMGYTELGDWVEHFEHGNIRIAGAWGIVGDDINDVREENGFERL